MEITDELSVDKTEVNDVTFSEGSITAFQSCFFISRFFENCPLQFQQIKVEHHSAEAVLRNFFHKKIPWKPNPSTLVQAALEVNIIKNLFLISKDTLGQQLPDKDSGTTATSRDQHENVRVKFTKQLMANLVLEGVHEEDDN